MKCEIILGSNHEEGIWIYARERTDLVDAIERLIREDVEEIIGYKNGTACRLSPSEIYCITVEDNKVYASTETD